jgi:hypothetical protein
MHTQAFDGSMQSSRFDDDDRDEPFLQVEGIEGSALRATNEGLTVRHGGLARATRTDDRRWSYDQLQEVRLDAYGPVGVIRATVSSTGGVLPLLLLEPDQIAPARRSLEIIWNLMGNHADRRSNA